MRKLLLLIVLFVFTSVVGFSQRYTLESSPNIGFFMLDSVDYFQGSYYLEYTGNVSVDTLRRFSLFSIHTRKALINSRYFTEFTGVGSWDSLSILLRGLKVLDIRSNTGSIDVSIQDQTSPAIIMKFNQTINSTTLADTTEMNSNIITVESIDSIYAGKYITLFNSVEGRVYFGTVVSINVDTAFMDTPLDFDFPMGSDIDVGNTNLGVDGSDTTQVFGLRGSSIGDPLNSSVDITRIVFKCTTASPIDLSKFGDLTKLTNGIVLRRRDGTYQNIFNLKNNGEIAGIMFDFNPYLATNPAHGVDGFVSRLTFAGQNKIGVVIRLGANEDLELLIQDDLSGLTSFEITAEGHIVVD